VLFVNWIFVAPKLKVKLERLVSARINHLETHLNKDVGSRQATEPRGLILCHLLPDDLLLMLVVKDVGAQDSRSPTLEFVGRLGLPWTPYGEGGEIKSSKGRLGDTLFLD
jgi:hypothetical protein